MFKKILFFSSICLHCLAFSQEDAWVYFSDKENVAASIANPTSILSQKAVDRKSNQGIVVDERDVPVTESYITQVKNATGIVVFAKSKWFNAVHVRGSEADINALTSLGFVDSIDFADDNLDGSRSVNPIEDKFEIETTYVDFDYGNTQNQVEMLNLHLVHQADYTGEGITVAVLDAGFPAVNTMAAFQRLRDNGDLLDGYDFVDRNDDEFAFAGSSHGTKVLSTMGGFVQDEYVGTAPDASYYLFRTEDVNSENPVEESYWVEAAERADSLGVDIVNTSLGYKGYDDTDYSYTNADMNGLTAFITRGATIAAEKGLLLINSAGNSGASGVNAPADAEAVFSIGAVDANGDYASFSSQGNNFQPSQKPDVTARGAGSFVIGTNDVIVQNNGTSFSSPILAGAMACFKQAVPGLSNEQIKQIVRESSSQFNTPDFFLGYGIPDFDQALDEGLSLQAEEVIEFKIFPNPVLHQLQIIFPGTIDQANFLLFDAIGKLVMDTTIQRTDLRVNLEQLSSGLYFARLLSESNKSNTFKLIKE
jgi:hypothetical protein